jgi:hypothetical protein
MDEAACTKGRISAANVARFAVDNDLTLQGACVFRCRDAQQFIAQMLAQIEKSREPV